MSLAEKWEEHLKVIENRFTGHLPQHIEDIAQRAFYAGAEAAIRGTSESASTLLHYQAEIDILQAHGGSGEL